MRSSRRRTSVSAPERRVALVQAGEDHLQACWMRWPSTSAGIDGCVEKGIGIAHPKFIEAAYGFYLETL